jgi:FixJ family two-component response regulator
MTAAAAATVFVVDDDDLVRASIQGMLKSVGLRSETFGTPQEFPRSKRPDAPSCLFLDVRLRGVNGLDFQHQLVDAGIRIPVIFITGHGDIPMTVKAMKSGAVEFLTKPFRDQDLLDAIHQALDRDRVWRQQQSELGELRKRYELLTARDCDRGRIFRWNRTDLRAVQQNCRITDRAHDGGRYCNCSLSIRPLFELVRQTGRTRD